MAFSLPPLDRNTADAFDRGVKDLLDQDDSPDFASFGERYFVHIYSLTLEQLIAGVDMNTLQPVAWRFVVSGDEEDTLSDGSSIVISSEMSINTPQTPSVLLSTREDDGAKRQLAALQFIWGLPDIGPHDYQLRYLAVPALSIEVFWFRGLNAQHPDLAVAVSPQVVQLHDREVIPMTQFLSVAKQLAAQRIAFDDGIDN